MDSTMNHLRGSFQFRQVDVVLLVLLAVISIVYWWTRSGRASVDDLSSSTSPQETESEREREFNGVQISSSLFKLYELAPQHTISIDIIFFHGLQFQDNFDAHVSTWRSGDASQEVWPRSWLSGKYPDARIISVSYDAFITTTDKQGRMDLHLIGENLLREILWAREKHGKECPVVLVGHSFGGLVIKQLCLLAERNRKESAAIPKFLDSIRGICFYGTPHRGIDGVLGHPSVMRSKRANKPLLTFVKLLGREGARLHDEFEQRCLHYKWHIFGLGELQAMKGQRNPLVPEASSRFGRNYISVESDHVSICRPASKTCNKYLHLVHLIDVIYKEKSQDERRNQVTVFGNVVGVESLLLEVQKQFQEHVFVGFCGMGGVGKTTIAKLLFNALSATFEYTCFVSEVKLIQGNKKGIKEEMWRNMHHNGCSVSEGTCSDMWMTVKGKKLLLVFDDIDKREHVDLLLEAAHNNASERSRFVATSRNAELLRLLVGIHICTVPFLEHRVARQLFTACAFPGQKEPPAHLKDNVDEVVNGCAGLPLTLEVLGKYLLGESEVKIWDETVKALREAAALPLLEETVWEKLRLSYNALPAEEQDMFLDVASFLLSEDCSFSFKEITTAWSSMYECVHMRWKTLVDRSLIQEEEMTYNNYSSRLAMDTSGRKSKVQMHEHLRRMGQKIALGRYISMIDGEWTKEDNSMQVEKVVALRVQFSLGSDMNDLSDFPFRIRGHNVTDDSSDDGDDYGSCSSCRMQKFFSKVNVIRYLDLSIRDSACVSCERCNTSTGFSLPHGLVMLQWTGFNANVKLPLKGSVCRKLVVLILDRWDDCSLDILSPQGCGHLSRLEQFTLRSQELVCLPDAFGSLTSLKQLTINRAGRLRELPETLGNLSGLESLHIGYCKEFERLPETLGNLGSLKELTIYWVERLRELPETLGNLSGLESLQICYCEEFERLPETLGNLGSLKELIIDKVGRLRELPETLGNLSGLESLQICCCEEFERLPETLGNLRNLKKLIIDRVRRLRELPETLGNLSGLESLHICYCKEFERLPKTLGNLGSLKELIIDWVGRLRELPETLGNLSGLESLHIRYCEEFERLPKTLGNLGSLRKLTIDKVGRLRELPETLGNLSGLESLRIRDCHEFERLPETLGNLKNLRKLTIDRAGRLRELPETLGNLSGLESLQIRDCHEFERLLETLGNLKNLRKLTIDRAGRLRELPETLRNLSGLESL